MARVKTKSSNSKSLERKKELLKILSLNGIYVTRIIPINNGYIILTSNDTELDKIFNGTTDKKPNDHEFNAIILPQLKANRSVLIFMVDNHIFQRAEAEMKEEILNKNERVAEIKHVFRFPKDNTIKITFSSSAIAKKAQEVGLKLFSMKFPSHEIH